MSVYEIFTTICMLVCQFFPSSFFTGCSFLHFFTSHVSLYLSFHLKLSLSSLSFSLSLSLHLYLSISLTFSLSISLSYPPSLFQISIFPSLSLHQGLDRMICSSGAVMDSDLSFIFLDLNHNLEKYWERLSSIKVTESNLVGYQ